jgi:hypothetical protein
VFAGWRGECAGGPVCHVSLDANVATTAMFAPDRFPVSVRVSGRGRVTSAPRGIACPGVCSAKLASYAETVLRAKPAKGWRFTRWSGACRGAKPACVLDVRAPSTARATFVRVRKR